MGVSIIAYSHLELTDRHERDESCYDEQHHLAFAYEAFARSGDGLADMDRITALGGTPVRGGRCYAETGRTGKLEVTAMNYSGYGRWRRHLACVFTGREPEAVWADPDPGIPFVDVIHFADNEGTIGPAAAARLADQFGDAKNRERFLAHLADANRLEQEYSMEAWDGWHDGTALAAQGGLIEFR